MAMRKPTGAAITVAKATRISVPTIESAMPPPVWPNGTGFFVMKSRLSAPIPLANTDPTTMASTATASQAATLASSVISPSISLRRRSPGVPVSRSGGASARRASALGAVERRIGHVRTAGPAHDQPRDDVNDQRDHEQDRRQVDQRRGLQAGRGALVLVAT